MATEFFHVKTPVELREALASFPRLPARSVSLGDALGKVLTEQLLAPEHLPDDARSTMDGFAVQAADTFGASAALPLPLELIGSVTMGERSRLVVEKGQAAAIPTGGYLPAGADAVVMKEQASVAGDTLVEVFRPVTAQENVLSRGEDVRCGETLLSVGKRVEPWDIGLLAALGVTEVKVGSTPHVVVFSTGDEVVAIDETPAPGQIRDANAHAVAALLRAAGCDVEVGGVVVDREESLRSALERGLAQADLVVLSGGSSVGERDLMPAVVAALDDAEILLHGVAMRPGKPTLLARVGGKVVFGLPGHPVSALMVAHVFLAPFVRYLAGEPMRPGPFGERVSAHLSTSIHSVRGREEYVRVQLEETEAGVQAMPLFGKSAMLSSLVRADGVIIVPMQAEGIAKGDEVQVVLLAAREPAHG